MKITKLKKGGYFVHITETEAISLIESLSTQLSKKCSNYNRMESYTEDGKYFSIAVTFEK